MRILVAIALSNPSDFIGVDKHDPDHVAQLGDAVYALDAGAWDRRAARDELKQILGFNKPNDSGSLETDTD